MTHIAGETFNMLDCRWETFDGGTEAARDYYRGTHLPTGMCVHQSPPESLGRTGRMRLINGLRKLVNGSKGTLARVP